MREELRSTQSWSLEKEKGEPRGTKVCGLRRHEATVRTLLLRTRLEDGFLSPSEAWTSGSPLVCLGKAGARPAGPEYRIPRAAFPGEGRTLRWVPSDWIFQDVSSAWFKMMSPGSTGFPVTKGWRCWGLGEAARPSPSASGPFGGKCIVVSTTDLICPQSLFITFESTFPVLDLCPSGR